MGNGGAGGCRVRKSLVSILEIGVACSAELPHERRNISNVVAELQSIKNELLGARGHRTITLVCHQKVSAELQSHGNRKLRLKTVSKMMMPRCGVPDKMNGNNAGFHLDYKFYDANPKRPPSKSTLTNGFLNGTPRQGVYAIRKSLQDWASVSHFTFKYTEDYANADLKFSFQKRYHKDNNPFDVPGGVYAHAWAPPIGAVHFDSAERWTLGKFPHSIDLYTISLHEIGHALGLQHSTVQAAVMYPYVGAGEVKNLQDDDIQGIRALYNL
ncbi:hypothetical protein GH714_037096 [Hevea brasiliensis]|uniref:Peptidase metallopeptidase domain-containing protein n=1 Tax=Hevea brasiliensis TaxID=3981 RepID=A0A6A6L813_HEVBR|nr:hypothetical protein GH714_037096 [Hevea brasiliensis]